MANEINEELEFNERFGKMTGKKRFDWMVKEIFFISVKLGRLDCLEDRVKIIEANCKAHQLDQGDDNPPPRWKSTPRLKYAAYGGIGTLGAGGFIYGVVELIIKAIAQRGGN